MSYILEVNNLNIDIEKDKHTTLRAVENISFKLKAGGALGIVGESGCGKSLTGLAVTRLLRENMTVRGDIVLDGVNISKLSDRDFDSMRGRVVSMIFQDSMSGLNPLMRIGSQVAESIDFKFKRGSKKEAIARAAELLGKVRLSEPEAAVLKYPHELSGGQRQRVMTAIAIARSPKLLIADEPTTALDSVTQLEILNLLKDLQNELSMGIILISHDTGVIREMCDDVIVLYAGRLVEGGPCADVLERPVHPYTAGLMRSIPRAGQNRHNKALCFIPGRVPPLEAKAALRGCLFAGRCGEKSDICDELPPVHFFGNGRFVSCHKKGCFKNE